MADEVLQQIPVAAGNGNADRMLDAWRLGMAHVVAIMRDPQYQPGADIKRDRLMWEMTQGLGSHLLRIGEGLLQREKTDRLAGLLEQLKAAEKEKGKRLTKKGG